MKRSFSELIVARLLAIATDRRLTSLSSQWRASRHLVNPLVTVTTCLGAHTVATLDVGLPLPPPERPMERVRFRSQKHHVRRSRYKELRYPLRLRTGGDARPTSLRNHREFRYSDSRLPSVEFEVMDSPQPEELRDSSMSPASDDPAPPVDDMLPQDEDLSGLDPVTEEDRLMDSTNLYFSVPLVVSSLVLGFVLPDLTPVPVGFRILVVVGDVFSYTVFLCYPC